MKKIYLWAVFCLFCYHSESRAGEHFKKVVWIVFENENYSSVLKQPYFSELTKYGQSFTNFLAEVHPSQGNYIAMIAGSNLGVKNDSPVDLKEQHVGDLLEQAGMQWRVYAEDYPGDCFTGKSSGNYVRKHVPFMSFLNVTKNKNRCLNIEDETHFFDDYQKNKLAEFTMYVPNMKNDGHDTGLDVAAGWLKKTFGDILSHPEAMRETLFIVTFDESALTSPRNQIYTVLFGQGITPHSLNTQSTNHAGLLKMIEDEYQIGNLGRDDAKASVIQGLWKN